MADRGRDDARDDRQVEVGVGVAREATGVVAGAHRDARVLGRRAEVQPPQRRGLDERDDEAEHDRRRQPRGGRGRSRDHDRFAEGDDDEQLAALGEVPALDVVVGRGRAAATRQPVARRGRGELERERRDPQHEPLVAVERRAGQPQHAGRGAPDDQPLEHVAQPVAAVQQQRRGGVATDLQRDVARREQQPLLAERLRQRGGHEQAAEHHRGEHPADRRRGRVEPVRHPRRVDPRPPDDEQQERGPRHAGDGEVVEDLVRQLGDREDVDEVEEQLDRGRRLRRRRRRAGAGGGRVAVTGPGRSAGIGDDPVRREIEEGSAGPAEAMRQQRHVAPWWPRKWWTSRYGVDRTAARSPRTSAMTRRGTTTRKTRIASGGHTRSPIRTTAATSTATQRSAGRERRPRGHRVLEPFLGGAMSGSM